ncbi:uncharacterized protein KY384_001774 [Bacidia gigantensis]|uniref:uncharacterized protein n=1 Tax=Bacidia gigantensis TaxID=2732470 RepID=UPI001D058384|nr:uncharacterized protein KY384_001774 [Bacidia gigantensis]KAG8532992.1 hypothetical protein KY384_001774 [Bacidia gigantensis]
MASPTYVNIHSNVAHDGSRMNINVNANRYTINPGSVDIDRCLLDLQWPETLSVKVRLKSGNHKVVPGTIDWILRDSSYLEWWSKDDVGLLWLKGGAGKGKTMIAINLIDGPLRPQAEISTVIYFFCQNTNNQLDNVEAIIKGLIWRLAKQQEELKSSLASRWNPDTQSFNNNNTSWEALWDILLEMLESCRRPKIYVVIDALDECKGENVREFLRALVRSGLYNNSKIKWLLISRSFDIAEQELLLAPDQISITMEANSHHISPLVRAYVTDQIMGLERRHLYGTALRCEIEDELISKAENTFLWVGLVCRNLEKIERRKALATIRESPTTLNGMFDQIMTQVCKGEPSLVKTSLRLLKTMTLAFRPLNNFEMRTVIGLTTDLSSEKTDTEILADRCGSFINFREGTTSFEFVHGSARTYFTDGNGKRHLDLYEHYDHADVALSCVMQMAPNLRVNFVGLPQPSTIASKEAVFAMEDLETVKVGASLQYAVESWGQHLGQAAKTKKVFDALRWTGTIGIFLRTKFLEWLEFSSIVNSLPSAVDTLKVVRDLLSLDDMADTTTLIQDYDRFLTRHYQTIKLWPLQIYSSALLFSPHESAVRKNNHSKIPRWLKTLPMVDEQWDSLLRTITGHSRGVSALSFSHDGKTIASGSYDRSLKIWNSANGALQENFRGSTDSQESPAILTVAYSRDGKWLAYGNDSGIITICDCEAGYTKKIFAGHAGKVQSVEFSRDSNRLLSSGSDDVIKVWNVTSFVLIVQIISTGLTAVAFSLDGWQIASGGCRDEIKLWNSITGECERTMMGDVGYATAIAYSPRYGSFASASGYDPGLITLWDHTAGTPVKTFVAHPKYVASLVFSSDGRMIASGSGDNMIKLWDSITGHVLAIFSGHTMSVNSLTFSPNDEQLASGSRDETIRLWDCGSGRMTLNTPTNIDGSIDSLAFAPNGRSILSVSRSGALRLWDNTETNFKQSPTKSVESQSTSSSTGCVTFSFDGKLFASASLKQVEFDIDKPESFKRKSNPMAGRILITIVDAALGTFVRNIQTDHEDFITQLAFSPDGNWIASTAMDMTMKIWNSVTGKLQKTLTVKGPAHFTAMKFSPDGLMIATASTANKFTDNILTLWNIEKFLKSRTLKDKFRKSEKAPVTHEIRVPEPIYLFFFFPKDNTLATDIGVLKIEDILHGASNLGELSTGMLCVRRGWICCGVWPLLWLGSDFGHATYDVRGSQLAIGFDSGRIVRIDIDTNALLRSFDISPTAQLMMRYPEDDRPRHPVMQKYGNV